MQFCLSALKDQPGACYAFPISTNAINVVTAGPHLVGISADAVVHKGAFTIKVCAIVNGDDFQAVDCGCREPWRREGMLWSGRVGCDGLVPFGAESRDRPQRHGRLERTHNELMPIVTVAGSHPVPEVIQEGKKLVFTSTRNLRCMSGRPLGEIGTSSNVRAINSAQP